MNYANENVVVTGGTRGIGRAICKRLAKDGYQLILTYKSNESLAVKLLDEIENEGYIRPVAFQCDMSDQNAVADFFKRYRLEFKRLDILVNNAGILGDNLPFIMTTELDWWNVFQTNIACVSLSCREAVPMMMSQKKGKIINITSLAGHRGSPGQSAYASSKAAIMSFSKALSKEVGHFGIRINCVSPGFIATDMTKDLDGACHRSNLKRSPLKRMGDPDEVAELVQFLANGANYIVAQDILIDGGIGN